jgi:hypothetical protein
MRADRPVLASAIFLAAGLSLIFCYGTSGSGLNAALPVANSSFHLTVATAGPAAISGVILTIIGVLFFVWAIIAAIAWHFRLLAGGEKTRERTAGIYAQDRVERPRYDPPAAAEGHRRSL